MLFIFGSLTLCNFMNFILLHKPVLNSIASFTNIVC